MCQPTQGTHRTRSLGRTIDKRAATLLLCRGSPSQPPRTRVACQSELYRERSSRGIAHWCNLPSGSFHSSHNPHSLLSASRVMPRINSGGPKRTSCSSPLRRSTQYRPARGPSAIRKYPSGKTEAGRPFPIAADEGVLSPEPSGAVMYSFCGCSSSGVRAEVRQRHTASMPPF